ncbi:alginate export family protein [Novosphingobium flavum]|uniref:Alginate export family protein n=1 Tax=Novosphingobium flavum TaxID=1778672 RepID=A0A7X1FT65_9SPHN|nr:alginate export family protein [Novosphingobium flavum]MBC2666526.1 alginate export family protein [Novosphingobium flavum]
MSAGYTTLLPAICLLALPTTALAEDASDGLLVSGSVRLRYEAIENQARAGFNASDQLTELRTQAKFVLTHRAVQLVAEVYDSRAWGANSGTPLTTNEVNTVEPVQAYLQANLGDALGRGTSAKLQLGRFTLDLGSRRLIANDDYRNTTSGFTGVRADVSTSSGIKATAIYVLPQTRLPDDGASLRDNAATLDKESFASVLWGGFLARQPKGSPLLTEASFLHFGERDAPGRATRDRSLNNVGLRLVSEPRAERFDWGLEGIYQWGEISASLAPGAAILPVSATFARVHAGYSFAGAWKPRILVEIDRASGDGTGTTYGRFDPLFGMRRADLGPAGLYNAVGRSNVASPGIRLELTPTKRFDAFLGYRALWLADRHDAFATTGVRDVSGNSGSFAGHQLDVRLRHWLVPSRLRLELDGTYLARGPFLEQAPNGRTGEVRYASFNLTGFF